MIQNLFNNLFGNQKGRVDTRTPLHRSHKKVRIVGQKGSETNQLRGELYRHSFERMKIGLDEKRYFEVVFLSDSIITDRLNSVVQHIRKSEEFDFPHQSVGSMIELFNKETKRSETTIPKDLHKLIQQINREWVPKRNFVGHSMVLITNEYKGMGVEERLEMVRVCAEDGYHYSRKITDGVKPIIKDITDD